MAKINNEYDIGKAFEAIEDELIASMIRNIKRHKVEEVKEDKQWSMWQAEQLKALEKYRKRNQKKFGKQFASLNGQIDTVIRSAKDEGEMSQEIAILSAIKKGFMAKKLSSGAAAEFFKLNNRKLEALIQATTRDMQKAETAVLRMANDQYRKVIYNAQVYANTGAGTYEKAVDMATKDFLSAGLNCIEYANGARHTLSDYADMAIRTAAKRAYLQGEGQKRQEWGISTVIMNKRGNPCPKCLPWVGKVLIDDVWSGGSRKDGSYPLMSTAIAAGLYHPRCRDSHTTYFEGISAPPDDKFTRQEIKEVKQQSKQDVLQQYVNRQSQRFERMAEYSLDKNNQKENKKKAKQHKDLLEKNSMQNAQRFSDRAEADAYHRPETEKVWQKLKDKEKKALWKYTGSDYKKINSALREGTVSEQTKMIREYIENMTSAIKECGLNDDTWVRRGVSEKGLTGLLQTTTEELHSSDFRKRIINTECIEKGFMSAGVSKDTGFSGINLEICLPKGTQAIYAEPFSQYGGTNDNGTWDGIEKASYIGGEAEIIIQRNSKFKVKELKIDSDGRITDVILFLIEQAP